VFRINWKEGVLISAKIKSLSGNKGVLRYHGKDLELAMKTGESQKFDFK